MADIEIFSELNNKYDNHKHPYEVDDFGVDGVMGIITLYDAGVLDNLRFICVDNKTSLLYFFRYTICGDTHTIYLTRLAFWVIYRLCISRKYKYTIIGMEPGSRFYDESKFMSKRADKELENLIRI